MYTTHPIVESCVRANTERPRRSKPISYKKLLPYTIKTLRFLIACAQRREFTTYKDLSREIGAGSPRNANWGFGAVVWILQALENEEKFSNVKFPNITTIVRKSGKDEAGLGVYKWENLTDKPAKEQDRWLKAETDKVFEFPRWGEVLPYLEIEADECAPQRTAAKLIR